MEGEPLRIGMVITGIGLFFDGEFVGSAGGGRENAEHPTALDIGDGRIGLAVPRRGDADGGAGRGFTPQGGMAALLQHHAVGKEGLHLEGGKKR